VFCDLFLKVASFHVVLELLEEMWYPEKESRLEIFLRMQSEIDARAVGI
jgi:hypothetical protein